MLTGVVEWVADVQAEQQIFGACTELIVSCAPAVVGEPVQMPLEIDLDVPPFHHALEGLPRFIIELVAHDAAKRKGCQRLRSQTCKLHMLAFFASGCFRMLPDASGVLPVRVPAILTVRCGHTALRC